MQPYQQLVEWQPSRPKKPAVSGRDAGHSVELDKPSDSEWKRWLEQLAMRMLPYKNNLLDIMYVLDFL